MRLSAPRDLVLLWMKLCANPLHPHTDLSQQNARMLLHFLLVLQSEMSQKYYSVLDFFYFYFSVLNDGVVKAYSPVATITPELCLRYCRLRTEGTFRATPLLACQLVSGDILYSVMYRHLSFYDRTAVSTSGKMISRICQYRFNICFLNCLLTVEILGKKRWTS